MAANGQGRAGPKPGARNSLWVSHKGGRDPSTRATSCCCPGTLAGSRLGSGQLGLELAPRLGVQVS